MGVSDGKLMHSAGKIGLAVLVSRILGLLRDIVFTSCFGGSKLNDAYQMAFRIPNLLRDLFAEGALSSAFVTVFARKRQEGDEAAWRLARLVVTLQGILLGIIVVLGIIFAPQLVRFIAWGWEADPGKIALTVTMTRILFPFILFVGMAAVSMGILNAYGRFGMPASASSFFNLGSIIFGVGLALVFDPHFGSTAMICMAIGSLGGGVLQWLVQVPALRKLGYRYHWSLDTKDPGVREVGRLMTPALVGVSAVQINVVINSMYASHPSMAVGTVTWLAMAFRLIQLPIGMFGVAISTASLPSLAVEAAQRDSNMFRDRLERALRLNAALCVPSACGLAILSVPAIAVIFEHGKFHEYDTMQTARILTAFTIGLVGYASVKVLAPAFYALNRAITPMCVSIGSILVTMLLSWFFAFKMNLGPSGLALATSCSALFNAAILLTIISRLVGIQTSTWKALGKILLSAGLMSAVVLASQWAHNYFNVAHSFSGNLSRLIFGIALGAASYASIARILGLDEVLEVEQLILKKLGLLRS